MKARVVAAPQPPGRTPHRSAPRCPAARLASRGRAPGPIGLPKPAKRPRGRPGEEGKPPMLPTQRRQAILAQVRRHSAVSADDLARQFGVSVETIRRDLRRLGDKGLLDRVYGGATRPAGRSSEGSFAARSARRMEAKRAIARLAASLVQPGETVVIDVGTTGLEVARALPASFEGRVLTNSVPVAMELSARREIELQLCGGRCGPATAP